ncbi:phosphatidate cytidylyltransferase [Pullulanibacillus camelliae]|uniref:Phosphatidate cytidylyltransferase n=1 Tax=Pullulanibacillus camelliae TaxID=1707096 RepID=A0A8J2YJ92_9BACL|nr:phosphatidate cytidylyltransferase [Pullulanibacillus camelliae]GGE46286.1 phosphatidate cytidylyltransferase [Pullulanibacillus camelliae]
MKQRIITGVLAGALFLAFLIIGRVPFALFSAMMGIIAFLECIHMAKIKRASLPGIVGGIAVFLMVLNPEIKKHVISYPIIDIVIALTLILLIVTVFSHQSFSFENAALTVFSALYVGFAFMLLSEVRNDGLSLVLFILILIWTTDSGAYFFGRAFGKHKLAPHISPNKTIEGMVGGIIAALIISIILQLVIGFEDTTMNLIVMTILIAVFGPIGDLAESALKRHYDVKDSGTLLPGHGGVLDRVDSWIFVLPVLYILHLI